MVAIIRSLRFAGKRVAATPLSVKPVQRSSFHFTALRAAGKESSLHQEGRADEVEDHKQDQLQKQKEGKGHWKDELASDSESAVKAEKGHHEDDIKADRGEHGGSTEDDIAKLQEQTKHAPSQKHN